MGSIPGLLRDQLTQGRAEPTPAFLPQARVGRQGLCLEQAEKCLWIPEIFPLHALRSSLPACPRFPKLLLVCNIQNHVSEKL